MPIVLKRADGSDASVVAKSISNLATEAGRVISQLNLRIARFQSYLASSKGRVEASTGGAHPDCPDYPHSYLLLRLHRDGKEWILSVGEEQEGGGPAQIQWQPLLQAPIRFRIAAVKMFPNLLASMEETHLKHIEDAVAATKFYDEFEASLPKLEGK